MSRLVKYADENADETATICGMAKKRPPATTPFGAWLGEWLDDHDEWTIEAFAVEVGVTSSAVSQWLSKTKHVELEHLRHVATVTGEDFENLYRMVYGRKTPPVPALSPDYSAAIAAAVAEELRPLMERLERVIALLEADRGAG